MQARITGALSGSGSLGGLTVSAYELHENEELAATTTASDGSFVLHVQVLDADAVCGFRVTRDELVVVDTGWALTWTPLSQGTITIDLPSAGGKVFGFARTSDGQPVASTAIVLYRILIESEVQIQAGTTDARGFYELGTVLTDEAVIVRMASPTAASARRVGGGRVDLVIAAQEVVGASEFDTVLAAAYAICGQVALDELTVEQVVQVAARSGIEPVVLTTLTRAAALVTASSLELDFVFALGRVGHRLSWPELIAERAFLPDSLARAVARNIIADRSFTSDLAAVDALLQARAEAIPAFAGALAASSPTLTSGDVENLASVHVSFEGAPESYWAAVRTAGTVAEAKITAAQEALRLEVVAGGHAPLVKALLDDHANWSTLRHLAARSQAQWVDLVEDLPSLPSDLPSGTTAEKVAAYATRVRALLAHAYPTPSLLGDLARADSQYNTLRDFVLATAVYEIGTVPMRKLLREQPSLFSGWDSAALLVKAEPLERLFRVVGVSHRNEIVLALRVAGYTSALSIVTGGVTLLRTVLTSFDTALADDVFARATHAHALTSTLVHRYSSAFSLGDGVLGRPPLPPDTVADWSDLFGGVDYCACEECQSVLSPAAYFVDLLQFLQARPVGATPSAYTLLDARRPDLKDLELSCANTNTPLPYIDLVNEILERTYLSTGAPATVRTSWSAEDLAVHPEHVHDDAYDELAEETFPLDLPYDLPLDEVRSYLGLIGLSRGQLCEALIDPTADNLRALAHEQLGLSAVDVAQLGSGPSAEALWGFTSGVAETLLAAPAVFLSRAGLSLADAQSVFATRYVALRTGTTAGFTQPAVEANVTVAVRSIAGFVAGDRVTIETAGSYEVVSIAGSTLTLKLKSAIRAPAGSVAAPLLVRQEVGLVYDPADSCSLDDATIAHLTEAQVIRVAHFVRLLRRTGLSITELDAALAAVGGTSSEQLATLGRVRNLATRLGVSPSEAFAWVGALDTTADASGSSPFERVFVPRAERDTHPLRLDVTRLELASTSQTLASVASSIAAALKIAEADAIALAGLVGGTTTVASLSAVYRHVSLARATGISLATLLAYLGLAGVTPFASSADLVAFVNDAVADRKLGLTAEGLEYVFAPNGAALAPTTAAADQTLEALRAALLPVKDVHTVATPDSVTLHNYLGQAFRTAPADATALIVFVERVDWNVLDVGARDAEWALQDDRFGVFVATGDLPTVRAKLLDPGPTYLVHLEERWAYLVELLAPAQRVRESEGIVVRALAAAGAIPERVVDALLRDLLQAEVESGRALDVFVALPDVEAPATLHRATYRRLMMAAFVVRTLGIDEDGVRWANGQGIAWDDATESSPMSYAAWARIREVAAFHHRRTKDGVFDILRNSGSGAPTGTIADALAAVASRTGWSSTDVTALADGSRIGIGSFAALASGEKLVRLGRAMDAVRKTALEASRVWAWGQAWPSTRADARAQAKSAKAVARSRLSDADWAERARVVRDGLRERQRDALLGAVRVAQQVDNVLAEVGDLSGKYLVDLLQSPCGMTSRLKQGISSLQTYVQRATLGGGLEDFTLSDTDLRPWAWMKNYRVWEANRKVFLWPENWIEPELRDDKTPFFRGIEGKLRQAELTDESVEKAYVQYLTQLHEVAQLQVMAHCWQGRESTPEGEALHVFARTLGAPHTYYWRSRREGVWQPWLKLDLEVEGDALLAVFHDRRIYLLWPIYETVEGGGGDAAKAQQRMRLAWSTYFAGEWSKKRVSKAFLPSDPRESSADILGTTSTVQQLLALEPRVLSGELFVSVRRARLRLELSLPSFKLPMPFGWGG